MELQTHGARKYPPTSALLASSAGLGWSTISTELRSHGVSEAPAIVPQHVEICLVVAGNKDGLVRRTGAGYCQEATPRTGAIWLSPAGVGNEIVITAPIPQTMHLYLPATLFDRLNDDFNLPIAPALSIRHAAGISDEVIEHIGRSILSELTNETAASRMYVETASLTLAARLLQKYCDSGACTPPESSAHSLDHIRLRRVLDYITANIEDDLTLRSRRNRRLQPVSFCAEVHTRHGHPAAPLYKPHAAGECDGGIGRGQAAARGDSAQCAFLLAGQLHTSVSSRDRHDT